MPDIQRLFGLYKDDVFRLALSYTGSRADSEDISQTVFLKLLQQPSLEPGKEKQWLLRVTANECKSLLRCAWWRKTAPLEAAAGETAGEDTQEVLKAVMALKPKYRAVVYLHYYEGCSARETASILGISVSSVTTRLSRARLLLKNVLEESQ
jgi:RNA polymerase sigma-70 factor (ECF subfamily)